FNYVAIVLYFLLLFFFSGKKKVNLQIYNIYYVMLGFMLFSAIMDVILFQQIQSGTFQGTMIMDILAAVYILFQKMIYPICVMYLLSISNIDLTKNKKWRLSLEFPYFVILGLVIASIWTGWVFDFDGHGMIVAGSIPLIMRIYMGYYAVFTAVIFIRYGKSIGFGKITYILNCIAFIFCANMIQLIFPEQRIFFFIMALSVICMVYSVKRPDEEFDEVNALYRDILLDKVAFDYKSHSPFFVFLIRIHDFKILTDSLGQDSVNEMFSDVVSFLTVFTRGTNVFRVDDNVLAIKMNVMEEEQTENMIKAIAQRFKQAWRNGAMKAILSASYVKAKCPEDVPTYEDFVHLISVVGRKEGIIDHVYGADEIIGEDYEKDIIEAIKRGLEKDKFQVYYQPIFSTKEKRIVAAEALVRLNDDKLGFISPEVMVPLAEREGYILEIGKKVFTEVCRFFMEENLTAFGIEYIEVNLSVKQCMHHELAKNFLEIMKEYGLSNSQINFEITESSAMVSNAALISNINYFEENGVSLSLDDYGTGYSNVSYLYQMPFQILKIDKSILWSSEKNQKADFTLRSIFNMTNKLGLHVVVEGVETEAQIIKLLKLGCDYFQGYYFSKPIPGKDYIRYLEEFQLPEVCDA
ncbi:MAG: EAL domain-containing protein, partial [Lachnospiraceae bacterium]|nr:EAL domain-containing protein [Lachnospiraceae bacterium]